MKRHQLYKILGAMALILPVFVSGVPTDAQQNSSASKKDARTTWSDWAKPLAQDFVVVHHARNLKSKEKWICVGSPDIIRLPSGRLMASMELWLQRPSSGIEGGIDYPNHCKIKASDDGGKTWKQISTNGVTWGSLFYANDALYMMGNNPHTRTIIIIRSTDGGATWSDEVTLFDDSKYTNAATPVHFKDGFVYRAFEDQKNQWASVVVAGDLSKDLLAPASWRMSPRVAIPQDVQRLSRNPINTSVWCLEGNVVEIRGKLHVLLRTHLYDRLTAGMTAVCDLENDGVEMKYTFGQFYPMPGGQNKFKILYDEVSGLYWTCVTTPPDTYQAPEPLRKMGFKGPPGNMRRILMLIYSIDGLNWFHAGCVAMSKNPMEAFHYSSQLVDGDDLLVLSRTSMGGKDNYNNHDSNMITLHRVKNFRSLALDLKPVSGE